MNKKIEQLILQELQYYNGKQSSIFVNKQKNMLHAILHDLREDTIVIEQLQQTIKQLEVSLKEAKTDIMCLRYCLLNKHHDDLYEFDGNFNIKYGKIPTNK